MDRHAAFSAQSIQLNPADDVTKYADKCNNPLLAQKQLNKLQFARQGTLLALHTKLFINGLKSDTIICLLNDDVELLNKILKDTNYSREQLKEMQYISTLLGAKACLKHVTKHYEFKLDREILNLALFSDKFSHIELDTISGIVKPSFDSLRFAVQSGNPELIKYLCIKYTLQPDAGHLLMAAMMNHTEMFHTLLGLGAQLSTNTNQIKSIATDMNNIEILKTLEMEQNTSKQSKPQGNHY